jgi:NAD(P)-dependent dehydrogenase (short-subunit alcohol dehydrogenase family)
MARVLVTGSADGLGQMAAQRLAASNHEVVLHARNTDRARQAIEALPTASAPDDMAQAPETQVWLAVSDDPRATVSGRYFYHKSLRDTHPAASDIQIQNGLLRACEEFTGVTLPSANSRSERSR